MNIGVDGWGKNQQNGGKNDRGPETRADLDSPTQHGFPHPK